MLPAAHRLRSSSVFSSVTKRGSRARRDHVVAYCLVSGDSPGRVGLIVGKSVGNSVARHRVARRIRAALRDVATSWPAGAIVVIRALPGAMECGDLQRQTVEAAQKAVSRAMVAGADRDSG